MADFWAGVAQGFGPAYQRSTDRRQVNEDRENERDERLRDRKEDLKLKLWELGYSGSLDDASVTTLMQNIGDQIEENRKRDLAEKSKILQDKIRRENKDKQGEIALQMGTVGVPLGEGAPYAADELESRMHAIGVAGAKGKVEEQAAKEMREAEATAASQRANIPPLGVRAPGMTPADILRLGAEQKYEDAEREAAKKPELSTEDAVDGIIQMRAQLGPEGSRGPQPSRQALLEMGRGAIMQLYGAFTDKIAVQKRERDIADYKKKGTGLPPSTRGHKEAAEAGVRYDELLKDIEKDLKEGKEPDPLKMREMKSHMAHVMAFYQYPGRLVPPHLEDLVRGAGRTPNNAILTDMANAHELSMYGESLAKDIKHLSEKYGKDKMTAFIGPIQKPLSELLTVFGIDDENEDRFIVNRLSQKYQDMANYKLFIESGKTVTEQEFKRLKTVVGDPTREDFLEKLLGFAQLQTERTQRKLKAYKDVGLRFNPDLEKAIYKGATPQGSGGLSSAEDTELQKLKEAKAANLMDDASKRRYLELLKKLAEEN